MFIFCRKANIIHKFEGQIIKIINKYINFNKQKNIFGNTNLWVLFVNVETFSTVYLSLFYHFICTYKTNLVPFATRAYAW